MFFFKTQIWPLSKLEHFINITNIINFFQYLLIDLSSLSKKKLSLHLISKYSFTLIIRLLAIEKIRTKRLYNIDFSTCFLLIEKTHPKNFNIFYTLKKNINIKIKIWNFVKLLNIVLQIQFLILLNPLFEFTIHSNFYGFSKNFNYLEALTFLSQTIEKSNTNQYWFIICDVQQCFADFTHTTILNYFPVPKKYKLLLKQWLIYKTIKFYRLKNNFFTFNEKTQKIFYKNFSQSSFLSSFICNYFLKQVLNNFFIDTTTKFIFNFTAPRFLLGYVDALGDVNF